MGRFILEGGFAALAPIAEKMGLRSVGLQVGEAPGSRWEKTFPKSRKNRVKGGSPRSNAPMRPYGNGGYGDRRKAVNYALFLAKRDGIGVPGVNPAVQFIAVRWEGFRSCVTVARAVTFGRVPILIPNWDFGPAAIVMETFEPELEGLFA
jgi:hypothetical protein